MAILIILAATTVISVIWVKGIDDMMKDPEWQEHKNDPDYWEWP